MVQIIIILIYFALTVAIGVYSSKKAKSSDSFHGAGLSVMACVAAGTGEWLGGTSTTGVSQYGWEAGIGGAWYTVGNAVGVLILAIFFARLYRSLNTVTVPGIMGHFLGKKARTGASIMLILVMIAVGTSQVIAAGSLGQSILGISFILSVIILGLCFIIYTLAGGMNAVASTNVMHLIAMYGGAVIALIYLFTKFGGLGWLADHLQNFTDDAGEPIHFFNLLQIGMPKVSSWLIAGVLGALTAQAGIQPVLAAKDEKTAVRASFITAAVVAPFGFFTVFMGMYARVFFPKIDDIGGLSTNALPYLMMHKMSPIIGGIVLASIFAAILSTVSPIILAAGTMFTKDIYQQYINPEASDKRVLFVSRLSTALSGIFTMLLAIVLLGSKVLDIVFLAYTFRGALFIILLYGIYWAKARYCQKAAILSMIATVIFGGFWTVYQTVTKTDACPKGVYPFGEHMQWCTSTYAAVIAAAIFMLIGVIIWGNSKKEDTLNDKE